MILKLNGSSESEGSDSDDDEEDKRDMEGKTYSAAGEEVVYREVGEDGGRNVEREIEMNSFRRNVKLTKLVNEEKVVL